MLYGEELRPTEAYADVALYPSRTYKIEITIGADPTVMYYMVSVVDIGAAPNLINATFIKPKSNDRRKRQDSPRLWTANKQSLPAPGRNLCRICIGQLYAGARFCIMDYLALNLLLANSPTGYYIPSVFLAEPSLFQWHLPPVDMFRSQREAFSSLKEAKEL